MAVVPIIVAAADDNDDGLGDSVANAAAATNPHAKATDLATRNGKERLLSAMVVRSS